MKEWRTASTSTLIGTKVKASPAHAALVNGVSGSAAPLLEDTAMESFGHPGVNVVPAALAVAEHLNLHRSDLLLAVVCGYEVAMRVGAACGWTTFEKGWHPRGGFNVFGAAAAAGKLLGLSEEQLCAAMGLAGSQAAGLANPVLSKDGWYLLSGSAAQAGVLSAFLAHQGWSAGNEVLEGPKGFLEVIAAAPVPERLVSDLGRSFEISKVTRKRHPASSTTHSAIDAIVELCERHDVQARAVESVTIETASLGSLLQGRYPTTRLEANLRYLAAIAVLDRRIDEARFSDEALADATTQDLFARITVTGNEVLTRELPQSVPAIVTITPKDGRQLRQLRAYPRGDPRDPLTDDELERKFRLLAGTSISDQDARRIWDWTMGPDDVGVRRLMSLTRAR